MTPRYPRFHAAAASFWRESYRELRRHVGDERFSQRFRTSLRVAADRALRRCAVEERRAVAPRWNRQALRAGAPIRLSAGDDRRARSLAAELGIKPDQPIVTIEALNRIDLLSGAIELLFAEGYQIVRIGDPATGPLRGRGVIDVAASSRRNSVLEAHLLVASAFVICSSAALQHAAYLSHTPSLRLDSRDPLTAYPVRREGVFTLATVVDLDTGRTLAIPELLTERYFRNTRNYGYRPTSAPDVTAAVSEMIDGVRHGWDDSNAQARFRRAVADAGAVLGANVRHVIEWDAASGFVGDGRLARVQAEREL